MKKLRWHYVLILSIVLSILIVDRTQAKVLDLSVNLSKVSTQNSNSVIPFVEAVQLTLTTHPDIESMKNTIYSTQALSTSYWQEYLPKLFVYIDAENAIVPNNQVVPIGAKPYVLHTSVGIVSNIWDGFKNWYMKQQADY